ncbi:MAG: TraR/DksA family transcriptional regulator [Alphaproteobacteria bacterium]|nr:MAG: TraR/DksA family transcriptional regulator [Alphaproteobacteria bacterium]
MTSIAERKAAMLARRAELVEEIREIEAQLRSETTPDDDDRAIEREADEALEEKERLDQLEIQQIDAALKRIEEGEYGYCVRCGEEIAPERLDLLPHTPFCARCAV